MDDNKAMKTALANIKALAKRAMVERHKAKKAPPPAEKPKVEDKKAPEIELEEEVDVEDDEEDDEKKYVVTPRRSLKSEKFAETAKEMLPPKKHPGRPKKKG